MPRILIIEDNKGLRDILAEFLLEAGHEVVVAADGNEATQIFAGQGADLVITDIFMPGKDGIEMIMELRQHSPSPKIIAISSGWGMRHGGATVKTSYDILGDAELAGADLILPKPVDPKALLRAVDDLLTA